MTVPGNASSIPLRASAPSRPGMRPAGTPQNPPRSTPQNAFTMALARAQAQNLAFQSSLSDSSAASAGMGLPAAQQTGLPFDMQALMGQQAGSPAGLQARLP